jgi:ketosteroid isomerase-like protein
MPMRRGSTVFQSSSLRLAAGALFVLLARDAVAQSVTLTWNPNPETNITGYVVSYGTQPYSYSTTLQVGLATTATITQLAPGQTYYFSVQARNAFGLSGYATEVSTTIPGTASAPAPPPPSTSTAEISRFVGGDYNGDSLADLLIQRTDGTVAVGLDSGTVYQSQSVFGSATVWIVVGIADFDADGRPDLVWQAPTGEVVLWIMGSSGRVRTAFLSAQPSIWRVVSVVDLDNDRRPDLIWQLPTGETAVWFMQGETMRLSQYLSAYASVWRIKGTGDLNGDGYADLVWQDAAGQVVVWFMRAATMLSAAYAFVGSSSWQIAAISDLDGDRRADLVWRGPAAHLIVWYMNGVTRARYDYLETDGSQWQLSPTPF